MCLDDIRAALRRGCTIRNFGSGYALYEPFEAYKRREWVDLDATVVEGWVSAGLLKFVDRHTSCEVVEVADEQ